VQPFFARNIVLRASVNLCSSRSVEAGQTIAEFCAPGSNDNNFARIDFTNQFEPVDQNDCVPLGFKNVNVFAELGLPNTRAEAE